MQTLDASQETVRFYVRVLDGSIGYEKVALKSYPSFIFITIIIIKINNHTRSSIFLCVPPNKARIRPAFTNYKEIKNGRPKTIFKSAARELRVTVGNDAD